MIFDLGMHIIHLIDKQHEVILFIDANEQHIYYLTKRKFLDNCLTILQK